MQSKTLDLEKKNLRELGKSEKFFATTDEYNTITFILNIESKIDFNERRSEVHQSINEWKEIHPLLNCKVVDINSKFYFTKIYEELSENSNVQFFKIVFKNEPDNQTKELVWKLLLDHETSTSIDAFNGLLWRLTFIKYDCPRLSETFEYSIIFNANHAITDAKIELMNIIELLEIILDISNERYFKKNRHQILPYIDDIFENVTVGVSDFIHENPKKPNFTSYKKSAIKIQNGSNSKLNEVYMVDLSNKKLVFFEELAEISARNPSKIKPFYMSKSLSTNLMKKCKEENIKLNGCLNMILILALKRLYEQHNLTLNKIVYYNSISLRQFLKKDEITKHLTFNYMANSIGKKFNLEEQSLNDCIKKFWELARLESDNFHKRIDKNEHYNRCNWSAMSTGSHDKMLYHYMFSNLGLIDVSILKNSAFIEIKECYKSTNISSSDSDEGLLFASTITIDGKIFWSIVYDIFFINEEKIDLFVENIFFVLNKILN